MERLKNKFYGKKILVVGLGLQGGGLGVAKFFSHLGAVITVTDKKNEKQLEESINKLSDLPINFRLNRHNLSDFLQADFIFKGPSVPWDLPEIIAAQKKGVPIEMELSFFAKNCPAKIIGVTGTRGKSTTTNLIYFLLKKSGYSVYLGGNLPGISTIDLLKKINEDHWIVLELSSWALSGFHREKISPHIAVFTNFYPDHLNYYKNLDDYFYDKAAIFLYQKKDDYLIANQNLKSLIEKYKVLSKISYFTKKDFPKKDLNYLLGDHNLENASSVLKVAKVLNLEKKKSIKIIKDFPGLPFRLQKTEEKNGIVFINDSTSTTPIAAVRAINTFLNKKIILILGGNSKKLPYDELIEKLNKVEKIVLLEGSFTKEILPILEKKYTQKLIGPFADLKNAIKKAYQAGLNFKDAVILFSPAATSFAMFNNEFHRGEEFNRIVKML